MKFKFVNGKMIILEATQQLNEAEPATSTATGVDSNQVFSGITKDDALKLTDKSKIADAIRQIEENDPNNRELLNILYGKFIEGNIDPKMKDDYVIPELRLQGIDKVINNQVGLLEFINNVKNSAKFNGQIPNEALVFIKGVSSSDLPAKLIIDKNSALYKNSEIFANNRNGDDLVYMLKTFALFNNSRLADKLNKAEKKYKTKDGKPFVINKDTFDDFIVETKGGKANEAKRILSQYIIEDEENTVTLKSWLDAKKYNLTFDQIVELIEKHRSEIEKKFGPEDAKVIIKQWYDKDNENSDVALLSKDNINGLRSKSNPLRERFWRIEVPEDATFADVFAAMIEWYQKETEKVEDSVDNSLQSHLSKAKVTTSDQTIKNYLFKVGKEAFGDGTPRYKKYITKINNLLNGSAADRKKLFELDIDNKAVAKSLEKAMQGLIAETDSVTTKPMTLEQAVSKLLKQTPAQFEKYLTNQIKDRVTDPAERAKLRQILSQIYNNENIVADFMKIIVTPNEDGKINWLDAMVKYYKKLPKKKTKSA